MDSLREVTSTTEGVIVLVGVITGALVRVVRLGKFQEVLERVPFLNPIPKKAFPWIALFLGVAIMAFDAKFNGGAGRKELIKLVVDGLLAGAFAIGGHETLAKTLGAIRNTPKDPPRGPSGLPDLSSNIGDDDPTLRSTMFHPAVLVAMGAASVGMGASLAACSAKQTVDTGCAIIDVANTACQKLRYRDADGGVQEVPITNEDAREIGARASARQRDGGP